MRRKPKLCVECNRWKKWNARSRCQWCYYALRRREHAVLTTEDTSADWRELLPEPLAGSRLEWEMAG